MMCAVGDTGNQQAEVTYHYFISVITFMFLVFKSSGETLEVKKLPSVRPSGLETKTDFHMHVCDMLTWRHSIKGEGPHSAHLMYGSVR